MKNQNKANACRTQIADISPAGKELTEEHLRMAAGGLWSVPGTPLPPRYTYVPTCSYVRKCTSLGYCNWEYVCVADALRY